MTNTNVTTEPTQVTYPWKATLRTTVQFLLVVIVALIAAAPYITEFIETVAPGATGASIVATIATITGILTALIATIARIMALPQINSLLVSIGLGATPANTTQITVEKKEEVN